MERKTLMLRIRVSPAFKAMMQKAIEQDKADSMSQLVRTAVKRYLQQQT